MASSGRRFECPRCKDGFAKPLDLRKHARVCSLDLVSLLGEKEVARLRAAFVSIDADGNGSLDREEVRAMSNRANEQGMKVSDASLEAMFVGMDIDGDGTISFEEFCCAMTPGGLERLQASNQLVTTTRKTQARSLVCLFFLFPPLREWKAGVALNVTREVKGIAARALQTEANVASGMGIAAGGKCQPPSDKRAAVLARRRPRRKSIDNAILLANQASNDWSSVNEETDIADFSPEELEMLNTNRTC
eukprot:TRINITY_DN3980_c0_g1_i1.p1 TRINITY_DN3980_c0_g1~~TRINITY_DN3980_c0_g1_i1.p1  ORF type:complete len:248 (+),score=63.95 TRINITY_DN3980_c0_g1_i1:248-991(+)